METITRALQRARRNAPAPDLEDPLVGTILIERRPTREPIEPARLPAPPGDVVRLDEHLLRRKHVIAFDPHAAPTRHYDILRNQIAHHRPRGGPHVVAV